MSTDEVAKATQNQYSEALKRLSCMVAESRVRR